jgi:hypothetical protein
VTSRVSGVTITLEQAPLQAGVNAVLDLGSKTGRKYYEKTTASLFPSGEGFEVEPNKFQMMVNLTANRGPDLGFFQPGHIAMIPPDPANPGAGPFINIITDYGQVTLDQVIAWETTFIANNDQNSQDSKILHDLLMASLTTTGLVRIQIWHAQYTITVGGVKYDCGLSLFKVIVHKSYLDSNATVLTLRLNLLNLDKYITNNGNDLVAFHAYVQSQVDGLAARGERTEDLTVNVFKGLKQVSNQKFQDFLMMIQNQHEDGSVPQTVQDLLLKVLNFYKNKVQRLKWEQPTEQDNTILALAAQLKSAIKKKDGKPGGKGKKRVSFQKGKQYSDEAKAARASKNEPKPDWIVNSVAPTHANLHKYRTWNGTKWYWCHKDTGGTCTGIWRTHHPKKCEETSACCSRRGGEEEEERKG